jgi:type I restriction-modification system DNA methylase subunit
MSLYQTSVLKGSLNLQNKEVVQKAYKKYTKYFLNPVIQENIRSSKEEEYQGIFLTELFVKVLDYTLKPNIDFNLVAEYKNQTNARKADGAILHNDIAIGVIELKGTNTKDLESIRKQAFDYKANQKGSVYVITSNFEKLRFYINDATEFEEFNLFELTQERFELFYLCLQKDNIINNVPLKIKEASIVKEEAITKEFYKDYSLFKRELYRDLVKRNVKRIKAVRSLHAEVQQSDDENELKRLEKNVKLTLFKKSQKLIDRFLFIFFAEDRSLLPANSTQQILDKWKADVDFGDERPLYNLFKQYFSFLDKGRQGTKSRGEIYAYNGGLFKDDALLGSLEIDNDLLFKHTKKLAAYDFESQVDVHILGHIFENSLNEIESVNAEIEGSDFDKQTSKRKKDGVFYTPKYITKYIVENTVGKLCEEKKAELGIKEEEYFKGRKNRNKTTITNLVGLLDTYRDWLLQLTICDPACGSGAFLNQALDFLIKEHTYIDELKTKVLGGGLQFSDIENTILENNIFGVDLNEESVEIAKLSLWLRTAQPRRKLNDLNSNIKCGNSLIDSKAVAGDKAFNWETQFPKVFEKGGFDVVIGNPPYVKRQNLSNAYEISFLEQKYKSATYNFDLYLLFLEKGSLLINGQGLISFINPSKFTSTKTGEGIREYLGSNCNIIEYVDFKEYQIFDDAVTYCCIITYTKGDKEVTRYLVLNESNPKDIYSFQEEEVVIKMSTSGIGWQFKNTIEINGVYNVSDIANIFTGIETGADSIYIINSGNQILEKFNFSNNKLIYPVLKGADLTRFSFESNKQYVIIPYKDKKTLYNIEDDIKDESQSLYDYLISNKMQNVIFSVYYKYNLIKNYYGNNYTFSCPLLSYIL